jgi:hypothetical protein
VPAEDACFANLVPERVGVRASETRLALGDLLAAQSIAKLAVRAASALRAAVFILIPSFRAVLAFDVGDVVVALQFSYRALRAYLIFGDKLPPLGAKFALGCSQVVVLLVLSRAATGAGFRPGWIGGAHEFSALVAKHAYRACCSVAGLRLASRARGARH